MNLKKYLKSNQPKIEKKTYAPYVGADGEPVDWVFRPITTTEFEKLREDCTIEVKVPGKAGATKEKFLGTRFMEELIVACTVEPNLNSKELLDDYGVLKPTELLKLMVYNYSDYGKLAKFIKELNKLDDDKEFEEEIEEVKKQ